MSYDPKYDQQSNSTNRSAFARLAFNIYGAKPSISPNRTPAFTKSPPYSSSYPTLSSQHHRLSNNSSSSKTDEWKFKGSSEVVAITKLHGTAENVIVSAGKNSLQMIQLDSNSASKVDSPTSEDLLTSGFYAKNKKKLGSILDVKSGHQHYSRFVAASTTTGSIFIFNTDSKVTDKSKALVKLTDHNRAVNVISFNKINAHLLLSGSQDGSMKLWDLRARNLKPQQTMHGNSDSVRSLQFSPHNANKFCAVFDSGILQRWDLRVPTQFDKKFNAHTGPGLTLDWNSDLDYVATGGRDKQLQIWNMSSAGDMRQYPEHVIYASSPIANICFRPSVNSIHNIINSEIALSYLNSEPIVHVYSAKRKYVPLYSIESHEGPITALMWDSDRYLFTASKDKTIVKNDLKFHERFVDNLNITGTTWNIRNEFVFLEQPKSIHMEEEQDLDVQSSNFFHQSNHSGHHLSTSPSSSHMLPESVSSSSFSSNRPQLSRNSSSLRPSMARDQSHFSNTNAVNSSSNSSCHFLIPVALPIMKSEETLRNLCESYEFDPRENDLLEICDINSAVALKCDLPRDSRTWKVIKESLIWESKQSVFERPGSVTGTITTAMIQENGVFNQVGIIEDEDGDDFGSDKYHYSTSNSTNYGKSPTFSDTSTDPALLRNRGASTTSSDHYGTDSPNIRQSFGAHFGRFKDQAIHEEVRDDDKAPVNPVASLKWCDITLQDSTNLKNGSLGDEEEKPSETGSINAVEKDDNNFSESTAMPLDHSDPIPFSRRTPRKSITSLLASLPQNFKTDSPALSVISSLSTSNYGPIVDNKLDTRSTNTPINSNLFKDSVPSSYNPAQTSYLTQQLTAASGENTMRSGSIISVNEDTRNTVETLPPFEAKRLIKTCIDFYIDQGDLIMSSTLLLLFNDKFDLFPDIQRDEVLFNYLQFLQRLKIWKVFIKFLYLSKLTEVFGNFSNNVKIFCTKCDKLIINEVTKQKYLMDTSIQFGSWYCENCLNIMRCVYCEEPVKKLNISRLKCGHIGHFQCFENWVLNERMVECPGGCP